MNLWFDNKNDLDRFLTLCKQSGVHGSYKLRPESHWRYRVTAEVEGKTKEKLTADWAKLSAIRQN